MKFVIETRKVNSRLMRDKHQFGLEVRVFVYAFGSGNNGVRIHKLGFGKSIIFMEGFRSTKAIMMVR